MPNLILFAKAPIPGHVKTRLCPPLTHQQAVQVSKQLCMMVIKNCMQAALGRVFLACDQIEHPFFQICAAEFALELIPQKGASLTERLTQVTQSFATKPAPLIILGTDCPFITSSYLKDALQLLQQQDFVIGPADDGGYNLIAGRNFPSTLFQGITWGSSQVLQQTCAKMTALKRQYALLPSLPDIDRPQDLALLDFN